ncbi:MAG: efflux RND transporter periplasmic adaptor subunit [Planctomycetaceae bacterium]|nr:efflux RND transporter periplasmic adaptor subunit [Planctomycetaceae bacterium]
MKFLWPPLAILTCISAGWMMYRDSMQTEPVKEEKSRPKTAIAVEVTHLTKRDLVESVDLVGSLEAHVDIQIHARGEGYLVQLPFDVQDEVKEGAVIALLDDSEQQEMVASTAAALKVTQARLKAQQTKLDQALSNYRRQQELDKSGVATLQQLEESRAEFEIAQAELELQQAEVDEAIANHHSSEMNLKQMQVLSPLSGYVAERFMHPGDLVSPDKEIMRIVSIDEVKTVVNIVEKDYGKVRIGQVADIRTEMFPGKVFQGTVVRKAPVVDPNTRMAEIHIQIPNEDHALKPGMHARVRIRTNEISGANVVPIASLLQQHDQSRLYIVEGEPATTKLKDVKTGATDGEFVEIVSGVQPEDRIVALGSQIVEDGDNVLVRSAEERAAEVAETAPVSETPQEQVRTELERQKKVTASAAE